jgi:multiple sugar transport system ATP-binding protein
MRHYLRVQRFWYRHNSRLLSRYLVVTLYDNPVNLFVAGFISSPAMNFIRARLDGRTAAARPLRKHAHPVDQGVLAEHQEVGRYAGRELILGIRPEDIEDMRLTRITGDSDCVTVAPQVIGSMGPEMYVYFSLPRELAANPESGEKRRKGERIHDAGGLRPQGCRASHEHR